MRTAAFFLAMTMLAGCATAASVKYRRLQEGAYAAASFDEPSVVIARDAETYARLWNNLIGGGKAPDVDFTKESVIFLLDRQRSTGGYSLVPKSVTVAKDKVTVMVMARHPQPGRAVTQVLTSPYAVIAVGKAKVASAEWVDAAGGKVVARGPKAADKRSTQ